MKALFLIVADGDEGKHMDDLVKQTEALARNVDQLHRVHSTGDSGSRLIRNARALNDKAVKLAQMLNSPDDQRKGGDRRSGNDRRKIPREGDRRKQDRRQSDRDSEPNLD